MILMGPVAKDLPGGMPGADHFAGTSAPPGPEGEARQRAARKTIRWRVMRGSTTTAALAHAECATIAHGEARSAKQTPA
jgi:hypothetical protein